MAAVFLAGTPLPTRRVAAAAPRKATRATVAALRNIEVNTPAQKDKAAFRNAREAAPAPKLLTRVEQLRLLSRVEEAGLLSLAEKSGFTLSKIEQLGLLSKAESLGALSLATDRGTPGALSSAGVALLAVAAAVVYFVPDTDTTLLVAQAVGAGVCVAGALGALVGASVLGNLQK